MKGVPFTRFKKFMATMMDLMAQHGKAGDPSWALREAGGYTGRGKGKGLVTYAGAGTVAASKRLAAKARNIKRNRAAHRR